MTDSFTIARVRVLHGHTSPETAYLVGDYPYGRRLRCQIRYWIETSVKGRAKGDQRFVSQTTNPKSPTLMWNKPKASTYSALMVMYLDEKNHVQAHHIPFWIDGEFDTRTRAMGVYDAFTDDERQKYDRLLTLSRRANPSTWTRWETTVALLASHIGDTGEGPELTNGTWKDAEGKPHYLSDPAAFVTAARAQIADGIV